MLPEVQTVSIADAGGARRGHETSAPASDISGPLGLCRIGKRYAVSEERRPNGRSHRRRVSRQLDVGCAPSMGIARVL